MKQVVISVISDLCTDQRVLKTAASLSRNGYNVLLLGRKLKHSLPVQSDGFKVKRFRLLFNSGPLFYANYNLRLFLFLLFKKADILLANDLDTLPANYLASKFKGSKLVYDSHEYFTEVPELTSRPNVQRIWRSIEEWILPNVKFMYTVNRSIADLYNSKYNIDVGVVRNIPDSRNRTFERSDKIRAELGIQPDEKLLILQGSGININRGAEEALVAMKDVENCKLLIAGGGDVVDDLKRMASDEDLDHKVIFKSRMPYEELMQYTASADLGLTLDKDTNLNYKYSLPNKLFDYIHAGIPVLCSDLTEIARIVETYKIGILVADVSPKVIAKAVIDIFADETTYSGLRNNTIKAAQELNWKEEEKELLAIFNRVEE